MINSLDITPLNVFLTWLSIVSLILFFYCAYKLSKVNKQLETESKEYKKRLDEIEEKSTKDYQSIISAANSKAEEIISQANQISRENNEKINTSLSHMIDDQKKELEIRSEKIAKQHEEEIRELNNNIVLLLTNIYKDIESSTRADLEKYKEAIQKQTFEAEQLAQARMKEEYVKLEKELEAKKQQKLQDLENNIYKILTIISKDIIGKSLDLSSHQEIIIKSLDDAKKEGVI